MIDCPEQRKSACHFFEEWQALFRCGHRVYRYIPYCDLTISITFMAGNPVAFFEAMSS